MLKEVKETNSELEQIKKEISKHITGKRILYLTTYRRIEEELFDIKRFSRENSSEDLIQFGMRDVQERIEKITNDLKDSTAELYKKLNGDMLTHLASSKETTDDMLSKLKEKENVLKTVFSRIDSNILESTENTIFNLIKEDKIKEDRYRSLVFFLDKLIDINSQQEKTDQAIEKFTQITNQYLVDKEFSYDKNKVSLQILDKHCKKGVELKSLSSGEKQLIALFSKLYLDEDKYIIIFDEPELSLSMEWQKALLPNVVDSGNCAFLVAATHSPFIFENKLEENTGIIEVTRKEANCD